MNSKTINSFFIATLGVSIVIAGQFSGWNFGLVYGLKNMLIGTSLMFIFYLGFLQLISEMGSTWPSAGGLAKYTTLAFGRLPGGLVNVSMAMALIAGTGIVGGFIASYGETVLGIDGVLIKAILFTLVLIMHLKGTKESIWFVVLAGLVAVSTIIIFSGLAMVNFDIKHFESGDAAVSLEGIIKVLPFSLWMFVGVEQAITASEETRDPGKNIPRGFLLAILILLITASGVLFGTIGLGNFDKVIASGDPLLAALGKNNFPYMHAIIGFGALFGLLASFFSLSYSASRQLFDLSRNHFAPNFFCRLSLKGVPMPSFVAVMSLGFIVSFVNPEKVLLAMVLLFTSTYFLTTLSYLKLKKSACSVKREYKAIGGLLTPLVTLVLSLLICLACFSVDLLTLSVIFSTFILVFLYHTLKIKSDPSLSKVNG